MKILIANDTYYPNVDGSAYFTHRLAFYLKQQNHDVLVVAPSPHSFHNHFSEENNIKSFRIFSVPILVVKNFRFTPPFFIKRSIKKVMEEFNPDVVHVQGHFPLSKAVLVIAKKRGIPVVGTNHFMPENISHYIPMPFRVKKGIERLAWAHFKWVFNRLDIVTTPTKTAADLLLNIGLSKKVHPVSNGIDLEKFNKNNCGVNIKNKYNLPNKPLLLFVGRLDKDKQIDVILRAMPDLLKKCDIHFAIVGKGYGANNLKELAKRLNLESSTTFTGFVPDDELPSMYNAAECFVIACPVELQSLVTMEAMASGLPVVGVNAMALPELVHDGENGFLFEKGDHKELASKLIKIFSDEKSRKQMSQKSLEIIKQHDIKISIEKYESFYKQLVKK